jgi:hypothetical protein
VVSFTKRGDGKKETNLKNSPAVKAPVCTDNQPLDNRAWRKEKSSQKQKKKKRALFSSHRLASIADAFRIDVATTRPWAGRGGHWGNASGYAAKASRKASRT